VRSTAGPDHVPLRSIMARNFNHGR
jgi:hypothetical protein